MDDDGGWGSLSFGICKLNLVAFPQPTKDRESNLSVDERYYIYDDGRRKCLLGPRSLLGVIFAARNYYNIIINAPLLTITQFYYTQFSTALLFIFNCLLLID